MQALQGRQLQGLYMRWVQEVDATSKRIFSAKMMIVGNLVYSLKIVISI